MAMTQQPQYTVAEFQCAIAVAKLGRVDDVPTPLRDLARGIAEQSDYIYRITCKDVDAYLAECADLDDRQRIFFRTRAAEYINAVGMFPESLQVCFDLAYTDALGASRDDLGSPLNDGTE